MTPSIAFCLCDGCYPILSIQPIRRTSSTAPQSNNQQFSYTERSSICKMYPHYILTQENEQGTQSNNTHYKSQDSGPGNVAQPRLPPIVHNRASTDKNGYPDPHSLLRPPHMHGTGQCLHLNHTQMTPMKLLKHLLLVKRVG